MEEESSNWTHPTQSSLDRPLTPALVSLHPLNKKTGGGTSRRHPTETEPSVGMKTKKRVREEGSRSSTGKGRRKTQTFTFVKGSSGVRGLPGGVRLLLKYL